MNFVIQLFFNFAIQWLIIEYILISREISYPINYLTIYLNDELKPTKLTERYTKFSEIRMQFTAFRSLKVAENLISVKTEIPWFVNGA